MGLATFVCKIVINVFMSGKEIIDLAPLQGFTDFVFRSCHHQVFGSIDTYYIPYISVGKGKKIRNSQYRDVLPENNQGIPVVPQVLCANVDELRLLADELKQLNYSSVNLNLGCPYPMATKRGRGTGLLENDEMLRAVLDCLFSDYDFQVSVKFRSGLVDDQVIFKEIDTLAAYPFSQLIFHPRTAKQMYKGQADRDLFVRLASEMNRPLVYNGDLVNTGDLDAIQQAVAGQHHWMIGRGVLINPLLVNQLKGEEFSDAQELSLKAQFHQLLLDNYREVLQDDGHVLLKMKQYWSYFSQSFENPAKVFKPIKKATKLARYMEIYPSILSL